MKILIFCINYKSDDYLIDFISSIERSINYSKNFFEKNTIEINVYDNSIKTAEEVLLLKDRINNFKIFINLHILENNYGYFGVLEIAKLQIKNDTDCIIYSNVDILVRYDFFEKLAMNFSKNELVIAPSIISKKDGFDQNPKYIDRLKIQRLIILEYIYSNAIIFLLYSMAGRIKELILSIFSKKENFQLNSNKKIYAAHGSIFIFMGKLFFSRLPNYPCFLFGEEIFIAEEAIKSNIEIIYHPELIVYDVRHASIKYLKNNFKRNLMHKSIKFLLKNYYNLK